MASRALITIRSKKDRERAVRWAHGVPFGTTIEFRAPRRTIDQNSLLWARLGTIASEVEWYGQKLSPEDWKDILSAALRKARVVPGIDPGTIVPLGLRTSQMTKAEFSALLDLIDHFAAEHGVVFEGEYQC